MEVLSVATTVCSLCHRIIRWIDALAEKETLLRQISSTVLQVYNILHPFSFSDFERTGEHQLSESISAVGDVLKRVEEHLCVYNSKKTQKILAFVNPGAVVQKLKEDQKQLSHQLLILLTSIAIVGYFRDRGERLDLKSAKTVYSSWSDIAKNLDVQDPNGSTADHPKLNISENEDDPSTVCRGSNPLDNLSDSDAKQFWQDFIGAKIEFVACDLFCARLIAWYADGLSPKTCDRIIMRLDEYNSGGVTPYNLTRVLGDMSLKRFVEIYVNGLGGPTSAPALKAEPRPLLKVPLLVWIDDRPENITYEVELARKMGIHLVELSSTAVAKAWLDDNTEFIREHDSASQIRFISDNVRLEAPSEAGLYLNPSAGQNILQYLRGRLFSAPVLIYTGQSIDSTDYVTRYDAAGSTTDPELCLQYISSLAAGVCNDTNWKGFKVWAR